MPFYAYFRALRYRNYRLFFIGQIISLTGFWLTRVAVNWLVYRMTHSVFLLGMVNFAAQIPTSLLLPLAGVLVDHAPKQKLLFICQFILMLLSLTLFLLTWSGKILYWHLIALNVIQGIVSAFDVPLRQSLIVEMVEKRHDLSNGIALNSSMFHLARLIGPALAGILIALSGEPACFLLDTFSYLAVLASIAFMRFKPVSYAHPDSVLKKLKEGIKEVFGFIPLRSLLGMVAIVSIFGMSYLIVLPVVTREILHGGPSILGFLTGASGIGALAGTLFLAGQRNIISYGKFIAFASFVGGLGLLLFSYSSSLIHSLFFIVMASFGFMLQLTCSNSIVQSIVDDEKRGRIMSLYSLAFLGTAPLGSLWAGQFASKFGVLTALRLGGMICCLSSLFFMFRFRTWYHQLRPIYLKKGILQDLAQDVP